MKISRRNLLKSIGVSMAGGIFINGVSSQSVFGEEKGISKVHKPVLPPPTGKSVVILGGGYSGLYCATTLRDLAPEAEIVVVEKYPFFISGPSHVDFVAGLKHLDEITRSYDPIAGRNIRVIRSEVIGVVPEEKKVLTASGNLEYTLLLISTGIRIADEDVLNLIEQPASNAHAWEIGETVEMRKRVEAFTGGRFVVTVPTAPFKCPPGPYEVACLLREYFNNKKVKAEITVVDANDKPQPGPLAQKWTGVLEAREIKYMPNSKVVEIDAGARQLITDKGEKVGYDLVSIIPPNKAATFIRDAGLGDPFVDVDPATFRSKKYDHIFATGDCAKVPYTKSAFTASLQGKSVAHHLAMALGPLGIDVKDPDPIYNVCYPYVSSEESMMVRADWDRDGKMLKADADNPKKEYASSRAAWERGLISGLFGS
ncbi:MAG: NAD(P)/FAD-dependent oxidoreductase [Nitrospirae bacterium]|nr:NAD(P)/FAD-dependent oxidoreductase [Nitrospirota bacterium]